MTNEMKMLAAERELKMRKRVYPAWVRQGRMTQAQADYQIAVMQDIVDDYTRLVELPLAFDTVL